MIDAWPRTDVIRDVHIEADGSYATAHTALYLQGRRHHVHTTTILIAVDRLLSMLLQPDECLADVEQLQCRSVTNCDVMLTVATSSDRIARGASPAIRGSFCTNQGRIFFVEAAVSDERIRVRRQPPGIFAELINGMHLEESRGGVHRTTLESLSNSRVACVDQILTRCAIVDFVLEGTRQRVLERFGNIDGSALVVAGFEHFVLPRWTDVAAGCVLEYRLSEGVLSSGVSLVYCDFSFQLKKGSGRLTIARIPATKMAALAVPEPDADRPSDARRAEPPRMM